MAEPGILVCRIVLNVWKAWFIGGFRAREGKLC